MNDASARCPGRRPAPRAPAHAAVVLPPDPASPARARRVLRCVLAQADRLDCLDAAELACTELVTNAVLHAHTAISVTVDVTDTVRVEVHDGNASLPSRRHYDPQATTGRGLALVAAITDTYGVTDAGPAGKTVWFTVGDGPRERTDDDLLSAWSAADWDLAGLTDPPAATVTTAPDTRVRLTDLPATLWLAAAEHHDALLRELVLYLARHPQGAQDLVGADRARATLSAAVAAALPAGPGPAGPPAAPGDDAAWTPVRLDLTLDLPAGTAQDVEALQEALDTAEALARAGELLARPGLPEIVAVRDWVCREVAAQLAGDPARPWPGLGDHERSPATPAPPHGTDHPEVAAVRRSERCVAVADATNRLVAVSGPLAQMVGWTVEGLVGRRVIELIPPRLREAHVAGFTRHQTTGEAHVLGTPLTVPVLRADGTEVVCRLLLETVEHGSAGSLYRAWLEPATEPAGEPATGPAGEGGT